MSRIIWMAPNKDKMVRKCIVSDEKILGLKSNRKLTKRADMDVRKQLLWMERKCIDWAQKQSWPK